MSNAELCSGDLRISPKQNKSEACSQQGMFANGSFKEFGMPTSPKFQEWIKDIPQGNLGRRYIRGEE